ncbi:MAG: NAD-dependent epimerase/dehydratase family protein [Dissulfuribacterales bacterium]
MSKTVLITGAAGFIGRYVARAFSNQGAEVMGIGWGKFPEYREWGLSEWNECEVSMQSLCEFAGWPDIIVHCAGGASVGYSVDHPHHDFSLTVQTTSDLLEFIRLYSPETKLVYPSTAAVYGRAEQVPIPETAFLQPISPYGVHKMMAESLCRMYASHYQLQIAVVRMFSVYGEGLRKQLLWDACKKFSKGQGEFFGTGEEVRDWLHVKDAARLLMVAAEHASSTCPVVNGGTGCGVRVKEILESLASAMEYNHEIYFSAKKKKGDPDVFVADISIGFELGWMPGVEWRDGISAYAKWYRRCL